jgi:hypothetical protein
VIKKRFGLNSTTRIVRLSLELCHDQSTVSLETGNVGINLTILS